MFRFVKQIVISAMMFFGSLYNVNSLKCVSLKNQKCKIRPKIVDINSNNPIFHSFSIKTNKCIGNCNNISDLYPRICIPDVVKNLNVKVFNLMSRTNKTRHIKWHESWKWICRLDPIICNNKQRRNEDKCRFECKGLTDKGVCDKGYFFNPSNCECECDKSCGIGEYLDYSNCTCRKKLYDKLVEECTESINLVKIYNENENKSKSKYSFSIVYVVLFCIILTISIVISIYFVYQKYVNPNKYELPY